MDLTPKPDVDVSLDLTDAGRISAANQLGPEVRSVTGRIVSSTETDVTLAVRDVSYLRGQETHMSGESVTFKRTELSAATERQFSASRSLLLAGAILVAAGVFVGTRGLIGQGGSSQTEPICPPTGCSSSFHP